MKSVHNLIYGVVLIALGVSLQFYVVAQEASSISEGDIERANAYEQTYWDHKVLSMAEEHIQEYIDNNNKEGLIHMLSIIKNRRQGVFGDRQARFLLDQLEIMLADGINTISAASPTSPISSISAGSTHSDELVEEEEQLEDDEDPEELVESAENADRIAPPTPFKQMSQEEFLSEYYDFLFNTVPLSERCFEYYDEIDQIAQERDFPTALIIATWYREHSCILSNPENGYGNFQITSHHYPPGEIDLDEFLRQVNHFIDFSHAKWDWYDNIQVFGPEPVRLAYDSFDLNSVRKQAILYNGVYPDVTLTNSWYANENFTQSRDGRDGVVAAFIKALHRASQ